MQNYNFYKTPIPIVIIMLHLTYTQEEQITEDVEIDHRVHSRLIGAKGKAIGKVILCVHVHSCICVHASSRGS